MFDLGIAVLGLLGLISLLGVPYLLVSHARLKTRVRELEAGLQHSTRPMVQDNQDKSSNEEDSASPAAKLAMPWGKVQTVEAADVAALADVKPADIQTGQNLGHQSKDAIGGPDAPTDAVVTQGPDQNGPVGDLSDAAPEAAMPPRAFVLRRDLLEGLRLWLRDNWVLAAGAASLALAGVFLVQYGAEHGMLTPFWRVMAALGFGMALIAGAEVIRRRFGDETEGAAQYLPSALAGAGLITLFAGLLSARVMYALIDPGPSFATLCLVSVLALVLGWFYGPLLTALGILGASAAPFLVGGQSQAPWMLYYYFALIALVGLGVDTIKRWAWISVLALVAPLTACLLLYLSGAGELHFLSALLLIAAAALIIPERSLWPRHGGAAVFDLLAGFQGMRQYPQFPTRISAALVCVVSAAAFMVALQAEQAITVTLAIATLSALLLAALIWLRTAPALFDHALVPGLALLAVILLEGLGFGPLFRAFQAALQRPPETAAPQTVWALVAIGALGSVLAFQRMRWALTATGAEETAKSAGRSVFWALSAAVFAPALVLILEFTWAPAVVHGDYPWALVVLALAALMTLLAERCARGPQEAQLALRVALFAIAALTLIAFALFLLLSKTALTLALAVMVLLVVLIDKKFDLPALGIFVQVGVAVITYRLVLDPGFPWALDRDYTDQNFHYVTPLLQIALAYLGSLCLLSLGWMQARLQREKTALVLESAAATIGAVFLSILVQRLLPAEMRDNHAGLGLLATVWAASCLNQLYRLQASGRVSKLLRSLLALVYGGVALLSILALFVLTNPLLSAVETVAGPLILDSLAAAYLPLALVFAVAAWRLRSSRRWVRPSFAVVASFLAAFYVALEIRRFWRGDDLSLPGVTDPELYSYTVAMLLAAAGVLILAFWRRSVALRKLAMAGVVLTIAKVFLLDMSGLSGLMRVFSFMGLGLSLVGLAWLGRVMTAQWQKGGKPSAVEGEPR
jgi:uncharacterized membrane protein